MQRIVKFIAMLAIVLLSAREAHPESVGLVLSGGGAKGIAHIGVIKALEENNIPIDYITGTSMGAIVGGLYAAGYTPEEMMALLTSKDFRYWSSGKIDPSMLYYFAENEPTPIIGRVNIGPKDSTEVKSILPGSLISPLPMNFAFMDLFSAYTAKCGGDFNKLFVPFRCVASDVYHKHKIVLGSGSLGDAIRASMSFPMVFHPIEMDSVLVYDGGIYDNFPVDVMRTEFAPAIMIGSNVSGPDKKPDPNDLFQQLEDMIIQNNDYSLPAAEGIKMDVPVRMFGLLDWDKAGEIYRIGYETAMSMMDSIKTRVKGRIPAEARNLRRQVFKAGVPYLRFDSVTVEGGSKKQNDYIRYLFTQNRADTFGIPRAREAYYRALTPGRLKNLMPQARMDTATRLFNLSMKATVKDNFNFGFGGYVSSSTSSMLFMSLGYNTLSFNSTECNINGWIGQTYLSGVINAKMNLRTPIPSRLHLQLVGTRHRYYENDKLFFEDNQPVFITKEEAYARLYYEWAVGQRGKAAVGAGWGHLNDKFFNNNASFKSSSRDVVTQNLGQLVARYDYCTLNNRSLPTSGAAYTASAIGVLGNYRFTPRDSALAPFHSHRRYVQAEVTTRNYFTLSKHFSLGVESDVLWSTRGLLGNYYSTIVEAPAFNPTPSSYNSFNTAFHANSFVAAGVVPVWMMSEILQARAALYGFMPFRRIEEADGGFSARYGRWFADPQFFGELSVSATLPFATISAYVNYASYPARNWNCGISFGLFFLAPRFLR